MSYIAKVSLGTINYTDWLRVTAAPVGNETNVIFETWIDSPPVLPYFYLVLPNPIIYIIKFYDAPTNVDAGVLLQPSLLVNGLEAQYQFEERWYETGDMPTSDAGVSTIDSTGRLINDPYLIGKDIFSYFKEAFRPLKLTAEVTYDKDTGDIAILSPISGVGPAGSGERFRIVIINKVGGNGATSGEFSGTIDIPDLNYTIDAADINKRFRLIGTAAIQTITFPTVAAVSDGGFLYLDNTVGGVAIQPKLIMPGTDKIKFNGFNLMVNEFAEFWVTRGKFVKLQKNGLYWEVIGNYEGLGVGKRFAGTWIDHPNTLPEDGRLIDGDEYPRLYWWLMNILPATHKIQDDLLVNTGYTYATAHANMPGLFVVHSSLKKFRMPTTEGLTEKGLLDFDSYNVDSSRYYDYPGGRQGEKLQSNTDNLKDNFGVIYSREI